MTEVGGAGCGDQEDERSEGDAEDVLEADSEILVTARREDRLKNRIIELRAMRKQLAYEKKTLSKEMRNAEKKRKRLKKRAAALSNNDILDILSIRREEKKQKDAKGKAKSKGKASPTQ